MDRKPDMSVKLRDTTIRVWYLDERGKDPAKVHIQHVTHEGETADFNIYESELGMLIRMLQGWLM